MNIKGGPAMLTSPPTPAPCGCGAGTEKGVFPPLQGISLVPNSTSLARIPSVPPYNPDLVPSLLSLSSQLAGDCIPSYQRGLCRLWEQDSQKSLDQPLLSLWLSRAF